MTSSTFRGGILSPLDWTLARILNQTLDVLTLLAVLGRMGMMVMVLVRRRVMMMMMAMMMLSC
jgi:hypothetical protein